MSLDAFKECLACKAHTSAFFWMQFFNCVSQAELSSTPDFLSALVRGPAILKVETCFSCGLLKLVSLNQYSAEETKALAEYAEKQNKKDQSAEQFGKLLGGILGKDKGQ